MANHPVLAVVKISRGNQTSKMSLEDFLEQHEVELSKDHGWEKEFVKAVFGRVEGLDFADVALQTSFVDDEGKTRRIDFTISEGPYMRIAIEVDGFQKDGRLPDYRYFEQWLLREQEIVRRGWRLLRFANATVKHDPARAARNLQLTLEKERAVALALELADAASADLQAAVERADSAEARERNIASELETARERFADQLAATDADRQQTQAAERRIRELEAQLLAAHAEADDRYVDVEVLRGELVPTHVAADHSQELAALDAKREAELSVLQDEIGRAYSERDQVRKEVAGMKTIAIAMAVVAVAVAGLVTVLAGREDSGGASGQPDPQRLASTGDACSTATDWRDAAAEEGSTATVRGPILQGTYRKMTRGQPTFLDMGAAYPDPSRISIVIWGDSRNKFGRPESRYDGKDVAVSGLLERYRDTLQVTINTPSAIETCS